MASSISAPARATEAGAIAQPVHGRRDDRGVEVAFLEEHLVQGAVEAGTVDSEAARGISLGVEIDDEDPLAGEGESGREIDYGRRLADAAFLVGTGDRLTHSGPPKRSAHEHPFYQLGPFDPRDSRFLQGLTTPSSGGYA